jgi:hypothetical protein
MIRKRKSDRLLSLLLLLLILLLISIGSKQDQEQDQEQEVDLDLRLFSEENSRFSDFSSLRNAGACAFRYFCTKNVLYSLERYGIDDPSQPIGLRGMRRSAPPTCTGRALPPLPARVGRPHPERA